MGNGGIISVSPAKQSLSLGGGEWNVTCDPLQGLTRLPFSLQWCGWTPAPPLTRRRLRSKEADEQTGGDGGDGQWLQICGTPLDVCVDTTPLTPPRPVGLELRPFAYSSSSSITDSSIYPSDD